MTDASQSQREHPKQRINGLVILGLFLFIAFILSYESDIPAIYCQESKDISTPEVVMLGTSWCPYCRQARKLFTKHRVDYCEFDIERSARGQRLYEELNGREIPIILIGGQQTRGFLESRVMELLHRNNLIPAANSGEELTIKEAEHVKSN